MTRFFLFCAVRSRKTGETENMSADAFIARLCEEIKTRAK